MFYLASNASLVIKSSLFYMQFIDAGTMVSPTVYARRSLCYLISGMPH